MNSQRAPTRGKYPGYWQVKQFRRSLRNRVGSWLARLRKLDLVVLTPIDPAQVRRVIVSRRNKRLGNMLMLTPLLRTVSASIPHAEIDLLIGSRGYAEIFRGLPGVRRVWSMPERGWLWPLRMLRLLFRLHRQHYDLSIDPSINSLTDQISTHLCGAKLKLGFFGYTRWLGLTHPVVADPAIHHDALRAVQLVHDGVLGAARLPPALQVVLTAQELAEGSARLQAALGESRHGPVIGFFTEATGKKRLPPDWWRQWLEGLRKSGQPFRLLQLLPPGAATPIEAGLPHLREPDYRKLAALLGQLDLFVSCDAGPMHLASASGAPTIGLFHASSSQAYRPLGDACLALEVKDMTPAQVAAAVIVHLSRLPQ